MSTEQPHMPPAEDRDRASRATMRAIVQYHYGSADDVLRLEKIPRPAPGHDEVLLRVRAAGVDRAVWHLMTGLPYPLRLAGYGIRGPRTPVRGGEVAGRVEAVGANVRVLRPGDEVFGTAEGSFAEYACARAEKLAVKPRGLTFPQAAATTGSAQTALQGIRDHGKVTEGQQVLVIGASGGVGSFAVQIARALGADVTGVCSTPKVDLVRALGAGHVLDYTRHEITDEGRRYDVILDTGGHRSLTRLRRALTEGGRLVIVGSETGGRWLGGIDRQMRAAVMSPFIAESLSTFITSENAADLATLAGFIESGAVAPHVGETYPLSETPVAIQRMADGHARGKTVISV